MVGCPNCGCTVFERIDYALLRCENCFSLFDPFVHPDFEEWVEQQEDKEVKDDDDDDDDDWDFLDDEEDDEEDPWF